jgi:hypothetical protein
MSDIGEGLGTAIEGGLLGRTLDRPQADAAGHAPAGPVTCANCQTVFTGHFCPECGQKAHIHRSLAAIGHDIMHGVLHLDGKLWETLPLLTLKPGELTRRYIAGERAKFVSPMAMFLFTVFAMFAVFQMVGIAAPTDLAVDAAIPEQMEKTKKELEYRVSELEAEIAAAKSKGQPDKAAATELATAKVDLEKFNEARTIILDKNLGTGFTFTKTGIPMIDTIMTKWKKNPGLMVYKLQANGYKFSWLLIPLSIPFLWLMFAWRRQYKAYDHAVFVTYSLSFMSLLFIVMSILSTVPGGGDYAALLFMIAAPLHLYKQLRHAYELKRFSAFWRFCVLLFCMQFVLTLFLLILGVLGAF